MAILWVLGRRNDCFGLLSFAIEVVVGDKADTAATDCVGFDSMLVRAGWHGGGSKWRLRRDYVSGLIIVGYDGIGYPPVFNCAGAQNVRPRNFR